MALLDFLGTLFGIPHEVLGLTVLAWGNSVGDLSTNLTMAKRGLSNMAMTACFAGPVFNILVALGVGFMQYLSANGLSSTTVRLEASHPLLSSSFQLGAISHLSSALPVALVLACLSFHFSRMLWSYLTSEQSTTCCPHSACFPFAVYRSFGAISHTSEQSTILQRPQRGPLSHLIIIGSLTCG